ncbi:unnamed protein product [Euphydryas editha]|uniref:Uncharacterized protein n=1 Tax=Euphydryas editha TaxID=104508 RepID=A0AAU9UT96_EUPED|nr:unnamed protein product [Euphydryas editha]
MARLSDKDIEHLLENSDCDSLEEEDFVFDREHSPIFESFEDISNFVTDFRPESVSLLDKIAQPSSNQSHSKSVHVLPSNTQLHVNREQSDSLQSLQTTISECGPLNRVSAIREIINIKYTDSRLVSDELLYKSKLFTLIKNTDVYTIF